MPKRFAVRLPNEEQREKILGLVGSPSQFLSDLHSTIPQMLTNTSLSPPLTIPQLAKQTDGMSGSDLQELCRNAAMVPVREYMRSEEGMKKGSAEVSLLLTFFSPQGCRTDVASGIQATTIDPF